MRSKRQLISNSLAILFFLTTIAAVVNRQAIFDWLRLRNYQPSAAIVQLAIDTTMNETTRQLFYIHHPDLKDRTDFSQSCPGRGEKTIILGCYINRGDIYLFDVEDVRLEGIEQVTAAHEILHAVYDRLSSKERIRVRQLVEVAYGEVKSERIRKTIEAYRAAGDDVTNELHSILGTEVGDLPQELEAYYAKYFADRKKIVAYSEKYESEFTSREKKAEALLARIENIESSLPAKRIAIDAMEQGLSRQHQELEEERSRTNNPAEFNAKVAEYNNQVNRYRQLINEYNQLVNEHNKLLTDYNAVALEENELIKAIDSRPTAVPSQ